MPVQSPQRPRLRPMARELTSLVSEVREPTVGSEASPGSAASGPQGVARAAVTARRSVRAGAARTVVVQTATKNPYVLLVVVIVGLVVVFMAVVVLGLAIWLAASAGTPNPLAVQLAQAETGMGSTQGSTDPSELLANPKFSTCAAAVNDLQTGQIDPRVISVLSSIVATHSIYVCPLKAGHYQCVGGGSLATRPDCTESDHWYGRGVDISVVDGQAVTSANQAAHAIVQWLATVPVGDRARPNVGSPWPEFDALPGFFHDQDHTGHLHLGFCGPRWSKGVWGESCA
jgi:hypothetical protein